MFRVRFWGIVSLILGSVGVCSVAHGETDKELETAKGLFDDARRLMAEGKYDSACGLFQESLATARGIGTKFHLADCEEHRENFGKAQALFLEVAQQAREAGQADRERLARDRAAAIDEKLGHLKIEQDARPLTEIGVDGRIMNAADMQDFFAVAQGKHRITASASGKKTWTKDIDVPKAGVFVIVTVPRLENADATRVVAVPAAAVVTPPVRSPLSSEAPAADTDPDRGSTARRTALILGGVGLGATVAGAAFGLQYLADNHDAQRICPTSFGCSDTDISQHSSYISDAHTARTRAYLGLGLGAAALTGAAVLYFTSPRPGALSATTGFGPDGSWNVALRGGF